MATKKKDRGSVEKELKAAVKRLRSQLAAAEKSAEKWRSRAKAHQADVKGALGELTAVRHRLDQATASAAKWKDRVRASRPPAAAPVAPTGPATGPDETWTVTALRAEARSRGLPGYSRKSKAELLADLLG